MNLSPDIILINGVNYFRFQHKCSKIKDHYLYLK